MVVRLAIQHVDFMGLARIAQMDAHHEAVDLRFGQRECAFVFDGILGRQHQERARHGIGDAIDRNLAFFHRFQQRRLRLGRGPVDLVGQAQSAP